MLVGWDSCGLLRVGFMRDAGTAEIDGLHQPWKKSSRTPAMFIQQDHIVATQHPYYMST